jgi:MoxR-like ATPase
MAAPSSDLPWSAPAAAPTSAPPKPPKAVPVRAPGPLTHPELNISPSDKQTTNLANFMNLPVAFFGWPSPVSRQVAAPTLPSDSGACDARMIPAGGLAVKGQFPSSSPGSPEAASTTRCCYTRPRRIAGLPKTLLELHKHKTACIAMKVVQDTAKSIIRNVENVIVGKRQQIVFSLVSWFCEGHILLEDVPGVAKTMLARALSRSVGCAFCRIQCTPDLLPSDVTGASIFNQKTVEFEFRRGPLFSNIVLADEINRTTPRTQAAFLEAMAEGSVSVDGATYLLQRPFLLIATQNPIDHEGTFPLPEAQLDRFLMKFQLGYPAMDDELGMLANLQLRHPIETLEPVVSSEAIIECQTAVRQVHVDPKISQYILQLVTQTREHEHLSLGGSPRASIALYRAAQSLAAMRGRTYALPDDVKAIAAPVLTHRVILKPESRLRRITGAQIIGELLERIAVPVVEAGSGT